MKYFASFFFGVFFTLIFFVSTDPFNSEKNIIKVAEQAYFEGQKDVLKNDVRIKYNECDSSFFWIKSPWNKGDNPLFIPTKENNKN
jgi:hypothetical protein